MSSSAAVTRSLRSINKTKFEVLNERQIDFEDNKQTILGAVAKEESQTEKVRILLDALIEHDIDVDETIPAIQIRQFLKQSVHDLSVSRTLLKQWQSNLEHVLEIQSHKYDHASTFGRLVMEWESSHQMLMAACMNKSCLKTWF